MSRYKITRRLGYHAGRTLGHRLYRGARMRHPSIMENVMLLIGNPVLCTRSVVANRACGWEGLFESTTRALLNANSLTDNDLIEALIARARLEHVVIDRTKRSDQKFQIAYRAPVIGLENFYSFTREISYQGDPILWKQMPYKGFDRSLRLRLTVTGGVFFEGYCTKAEQERINHCLDYILSGVETAFGYIRPLVDTYNANLPIAARNYVEMNRRMTAELRRTHEAA